MTAAWFLGLRVEWGPGSPGRDGAFRVMQVFHGYAQLSELIKCRLGRRQGTACKLGLYEVVTGTGSSDGPFPILLPETHTEPASLLHGPAAVCSRLSLNRLQTWAAGWLTTDG